MRRLITPSLLLCLLLSLPTLLSAQVLETETIVATKKKYADGLYDEKEYLKAAVVLEDVIRLCAKLPRLQARKIKAAAHYDAACCYARDLNKAKALEHFAAAIANGYRKWDHIARDSDLDNIRQDPAFAKAIADCKKQIAAEALKKATAEAVQWLSDEAMFDFGLELEALDGKPLSLRKLRGKVVIAHVWATTSTPCVTLIQRLADLQQRYQEELVIIGLNHQHGAEAKVAAAVQAFAEKMTYPTARVSHDFLVQVPGVTKYPTTIYIDRQGRVRRMSKSLETMAQIEGTVRALAAENNEKNPSKAR